jgi:hypothetical protein
LDDYAAVYELVAEHIAEGVQASVPATVRQTVAEVGRAAAQAGSATVQQIAAALRIDKSAASRRCRSAESRGYLRNEETSRGRPARYVLADPLPDEQALLPPPERLESALLGAPGQNGCTVAAQTEGYTSPPPSQADLQVPHPERRRIVL